MKGSSTLAASVATKPVINAGDGVGEHPTQALLDLFTIYTELGAITESSSLTVAMVGDLKHGRTVHSLVRLLALYPKQISIVYVSPDSLSLPNEIFEEIKTKGVPQRTASLQEAIKVADVLYVTRIQKERFSTIEEYESVSGSYVVDANLMKSAKESMIVMHPLPRVNEISRDVDKDPRAAYFRQMENGMYMRMAILELWLGNSQ
jgi:aspartate carbamoyltransferase